VSPNGQSVRIKVLQQFTGFLKLAATAIGCGCNQQKNEQESDQ
jgi:hypothetical protein